MRPVLQKILEETIQSLPKCPVCGSPMMYYQRSCYRCKRREYQREYARKYRRVNRERYKQYIREYYKKHRDRVLMRQREYARKFLIRTFAGVGRLRCTVCGKEGYTENVIKFNKKTGNITIYRRTQHYIKGRKVLHYWR